MLVCESDVPEYLKYVNKLARENNIEIRERLVIHRRCTEIHTDDEEGYYTLCKLLGIIK